MADDIEYRKVQVAGGSTFTISVPKPWAVRHALRNGDLLGIQTRPDGTLNIFPPSVESAESGPVELDATKLGGTALLRTLLGHYLAGHDAILVRASPRLSADQRETIRRFTRSCVGPEILEETSESVLVRDLVNPREFNLENALRRILVMTTAMVKDGVRAFQERDLELARDVRGRDDEADRLHRLVAKRYTKMLAGGRGAHDPNLTMLAVSRIYQVSRLLERCADHGANVAELVTQLERRPVRKDVLNRVVQLGQRAVDLLDRSFRSFRKNEHPEANHIVDESRKLLLEKGRLREALGGHRPQVTALLSLLVESLERIHQYASDIAEVTLNAPRRAARGETP